jgi:hypothetical protein
MSLSKCKRWYSSNCLQFLNIWACMKWMIVKLILLEPKVIHAKCLWNRPQNVGRLWQGTFINVHKFMIMADIFATGLVIFVDKLSYLKLTSFFATLHYLACLILNKSQVKEDR